jgi:hypothetical protein
MPPKIQTRQAPSATFHLADEPTPFATDSSDVIDLSELVRLLGRPKSTLTAQRRSMELVLDRVTLVVTPCPVFALDAAGRAEEQAWREHTTLIVPEWGGCKMPHGEWTYSRRRVIAYRDRGMEAVLEALDLLHGWLRRIGERE